MDLVDIDRRDDRIAVVTLQRPERRNALSMTMVSEIKAAFASLHRDRAVDTVVLTGAGKGFCAGADLSFEPDPAPDSEGRGPVGLVYRSQEHLAEMILAVHECDKPIVAAVQPNDRLSVTVNNQTVTYAEGGPARMREVAYACWGG